MDILISQHNNLRREMAEIKGRADEPAPNFAAIFFGLEEFGKSLADHLKLEDGVFYPKLLQRLEGQGTNTGDTRKFIDEMRKIKEQVYDFLGKYGAVEKIEKNFESFKLDLNEMISVLFIRIYSEENGVYLYWK